MKNVPDQNRVAQGNPRSRNFAEVSDFFVRFLPLAQRFPDCIPD